MKSVPITTKVVRSNPGHDEVYSMHYLIKFVSDLWQAGCSLHMKAMTILLYRNYSKNGLFCMKDKKIISGIVNTITEPD